MPRLLRFLSEPPVATMLARDERDGAGADAVHLDAARRAADGVAPPR